MTDSKSLDIERLEKLHERYRAGEDVGGVEAAEAFTDALPAILSELKKAGEMREALKFYAAPEVYIDGPSLSKNIYVPYYRILEDRGEVARAALTNGERE